jgi:Lar family restriction alleviation protein
MALLPCPFCGETTELGVEYDDGPQNPFPGYRVICRTCGGIGPADDARSDNVSREQAIANWNRRPTSTLQGSASWLRRQVEGQVDELAQARAKREGDGLPTITTTKDAGGVGMEFDMFGAPPPRKPRKP